MAGIMRKAVTLLALTPISASANASTAISQSAGMLSGDTAWLLTASVLVLLMSLPGLALFYASRLSGNVVQSVLLQCAAIVAIVSLAWILAGYSLAFGEASNGWMGSGDGLLLANLGVLNATSPISESAFALLHMTYAVFAASLMVGAWGLRARFGWVIGFTGLWVLVVYAPIAHWIWGGGWLASTFGTLDFAGGLVVHTSVGVSALVIVTLLGFEDSPNSKSNPALCVAGLALLWIGWLGFNGGSALGANSNAANAMITTHAAACAGLLSWLALDKLTRRELTPLSWTNGAICGLVMITPAAVFVSPVAAIVMGGIAALISHTIIRHIQKIWKIGNALNVFILHGIGGIIGTLMLAIALSQSFGGTGYFDDTTMADQLIAQSIGVGAVIVWSAVGSAIIALMVSLIFPMLASEEKS